MKGGWKLIKARGKPDDKTSGSRLGLTGRIVPIAGGGAAAWKSIQGCGWMDQAVHKVEEADRMLATLAEVQRQLDVLRQGVSQSHRLATLGTMATMIAHEFNNILTPMISYCQMAQQEPDDLELHRKAVDRSLTGALRAAKITTSMLGFAREADEQTDTQLAAAVDEVFNLLARSPEKDGIELTLQIPADLRIAMSGVKLQQILLNLVLNARQAMRGKRGKLTLSARRQGDRITFDIIDTGPGIPVEIRDRLFEPFVTQRHISDDHQKGTGLGLAVCRDLITQGGGSIEVAQTGPEGTTFRLQLPAA